MRTTCGPDACATSVTCQPLFNIMPNLTSAQATQQAAYGAFGVSQNLNAWHSEYQALATGNPTSASLPSWSTVASN
jgi:hypothetical protein